jgi:hypothetical protein
MFDHGCARRQPVGWGRRGSRCSGRSLNPVPRVLLVATVSALLIMAAVSPASADIAACSDVKPPRNDTAALQRAGFAFDGVLLGGREASGAGTSAGTLISPLRFRVIRTLKGDPRYFAEADPSGEFVATVWDALYADSRLWRRIERQERLETTIPGEIRGVAGAQWRIYGLQEVVNWTSKTCLGSHPIRGATPTESQAIEGSPGGSDAGSEGWSPYLVPVLVGLVTLGVASTAAWRFRRSRDTAQDSSDWS